jgi:effector-binding domain-containing protein
MAESLPRADFSQIEIEHIVVEASEIASLPVSSVAEAGAISTAMASAYFSILSFVDAHNLQEAGAALSISRGFSGSEIRFDAGIPVHGVTEDTPRGGAGVRITESYGGPVIRVRHIGPYGTLGATHDKIAAYLAALGIERNGDAWESYVMDPTRVDEDELLTLVYYPILSPI